jgi:hypothetical protein
VGPGSFKDYAIAPESYPTGEERARGQIRGMSPRLLKSSGGSVDDYAICRSS